jgi:hypothetical protein
MKLRENNYYFIQNNYKTLRLIVLICVVSTTLLLTYNQTYTLTKNSYFSQSEQLEEWKEYVQIAILLQGLSDNSASGLNLRLKFRRFLNSIIIQTRRLPIRFIFLTDFKSIFQIEKTFEDLLPPFTLENYIDDDEDKVVDRFHREYIDVDIGTPSCAVGFLSDPGRIYSVSHQYLFMADTIFEHLKISARSKLRSFSENSRC